jgi:hypothetical protein
MEKILFPGPGKDVKDEGGKRRYQGSKDWNAEGTVITSTPLSPSRNGTLHSCSGWGHHCELCPFAVLQGNPNGILTSSC